VNTLESYYSDYSREGGRRTCALVQKRVPCPNAVLVVPEVSKAVWRGRQK
jgi:hypothetical protein